MQEIVWLNLTSGARGHYSWHRTVEEARQVIERLRLERGHWKSNPVVYGIIERGQRREL